MRAPRTRTHLLIPLLMAMAFAAMAGPVVMIYWSDRGQASFGDNEVVGVNRLASATVEIQIGERSARLIGENMAPGDRAFGSVEIFNKGTLPLRFALTYQSPADPLAAWLTWDVWESSSPQRCEAAPAAATLLVNGAIFGSTTTASSGAVLGDTAAGLDAGDTVLEPNAGTTICVAAQLDLDAPNDVQNRRIDQELTVIAEQHTDGISR